MDEIYKQVADKLGLSKNLVAAIYKMYCALLREKIREVDVEGEEISLNLINLGKIYLNKTKVRRKNEVKYKEDKTNE